MASQTYNAASVPSTNLDGTNSINISLTIPAKAWSNGKWKVCYTRTGTFVSSNLFVTAPSPGSTSTSVVNQFTQNVGGPIPTSSYPGVAKFTYFSPSGGTHSHEYAMMCGDRIACYINDDGRLCAPYQMLADGTPVSRGPTNVTVSNTMITANVLTGGQLRDAGGDGAAVGILTSANSRAGDASAEATIEARKVVHGTNNSADAHIDDWAYIADNAQMHTDAGDWIDGSSTNQVPDAGVFAITGANADGIPLSVSARSTFYDNYRSTGTGTNKQVEISHKFEHQLSNSATDRTRIKVTVTIRNVGIIPIVNFRYLRGTNPMGANNGTANHKCYNTSDSSKFSLMAFSTSTNDAVGIGVDQPAVGTIMWFTSVAGGYSTDSAYGSGGMIGTKYVELTGGTAAVIKDRAASTIYPNGTETVYASTTDFNSGAWATTCQAAFSLGSPAYRVMNFMTPAINIAVGDSYQFVFYYLISNVWTGSTQSDCVEFPLDGATLTAIRSSYAGAAKTYAVGLTGGTYSGTMTITAVSLTLYDQFCPQLVNPHTLTGTVINDISGTAEYLNTIAHRAAIDQRNEVELWYKRDSVWQKSAFQPVTSKDNPISMSHRYRQPAQLGFTLKDNFGHLTPENLNSPYNYNAAGVYDPLIDEAREVMLRVGAWCWSNLSASIVPSVDTSSTGAVVDTLTDNAIEDYSLASPSPCVFALNLSAVTITLDLGTVQKIRHALIRFGTKTSSGWKLPSYVRVDTSISGSSWTTIKRLPVGQDGNTAVEGGDYGDDYYGSAVTVPICDLDAPNSRYVRFVVYSVDAINCAIDEVCVFGGYTGSYIGANIFCGYLGDDITLLNDGNINITATGKEKKLADNNENRLTAVYYNSDVSEMMYQLLSSSVYWKSQSTYSTAFASTEIGWNSTDKLTGLVYPVWQSQTNSMYGYTQELANSVGWVHWNDGNGIWRLFNPPYRQVIPDRVFTAGVNSNNDVRSVQRNRTGKDLRNTIEVAGGLKTGVGQLVMQEPNSVNRYGPRRMIINDPILDTQTMRENVGKYVLRDYAWKTQTANAQIQPDFCTKVRDIHGLRASARPNMYSRKSSRSGDKRSVELWYLNSIDHKITTGEWTGDCTYHPYFPFATDPPSFTSWTSPASTARLDAVWAASSDPLTTFVNVYVSSTSSTTGFVLAGTYPVGTTTAAFITTVPNLGAITIGQYYWAYITNVNAAGYESIPSVTLKALAGTYVSPGTDCESYGSGSGYVISDLAVSFLTKTGPDTNGLYTYAFLMSWTAPTCGHTQHKTRLNPLAIPTDQDNYDAWAFQHNVIHNAGWDWWGQDRIPAGRTWDGVTFGSLTWQVVLRVNQNYTSGQRMYFRIWNSTRTRSWIPVGSNITYYQFP